jgi:cation transport ATPase
VQAKDGSFEQEPGSGAMAVVEGKRVAVGSLDWVQRYVQDYMYGLQLKEVMASSH